MSFLYPLGLLGLIGIPIIFIIYIIKNKHTEQTITTTHIWLVAERLMKKRRPISRIYGILSLIIQLIAVTAISLAISQPRFTIKQGANEYMFILDGSCSMNVEVDGVTRFEKAKEVIGNIIYESGNGSYYTLVYASDSNRVVYEEIRDKDRAIEDLYKLECGQINKNVAETLSYCQNKFSSNSDLKAYLITDKEYDVENVTLINLGIDTHNVAITDLSVVSKIIDPDLENPVEGLEVTVKVLSYLAECDVKVNLYCDNVLVHTYTGTCEPLKELTLEPYKLNRKNFTILRAEIEAQDGLVLDNYMSVYNVDEQENNSVLLVSDTPFILQKLLQSFGGKTIDVMSVSEYLDNEANHAEFLTNYKLFIFDSVSPNELPNAAVMFFNCYDLPAETNVTTKERVKPDSAVSLELTKTNTSLYNQLTENIIDSGDHIQVTNYIKYSQQTRFTNIYEYRGYPMVFVGATDKGQREVVFSFNISDSDLARRSEFIAMMYNLVNYCLPIVVNNASYTCGDKMLVNVVSGCDSVMVVSPSGQRHYLPITSTYVEMDLTEVGIYTIEVGFEGKNAVTKINVFSKIDTTELSNSDVETFRLSGTQTQGFVDGIYDSLMYLFIILAIMFVLDWAVYCYEQYQLR